MQVRIKLVGTRTDATEIVSMGDIISLLYLIQAIELLVTVCNWDYQGRLPRSYLTITMVIMSDAFSMGYFGPFSYISSHTILSSSSGSSSISICIHGATFYSRCLSSDLYTASALTLRNLSLHINHKKDKIKKRISSCRHFAGNMCIQFSLLFWI